MTEAGWTREKPTAAGWYWYRSINDEQTESVVWVAPNMGVFSAFYHSRVEHLDGEWLGPISPDSYQQGRVAALDEVERYMAMRLRLAEASLATEILAGNEVKQGRERAAIAELHGMQRHVSDIKEYLAQQAQEGGVGE